MSAHTQGILLQPAEEVSVLSVCSGHLKHLSRSRVLGGPNNHHGIPAELDDVTAVPSHYIDQHREILVCVRL